MKKIPSLKFSGYSDESIFSFLPSQQQSLTPINPVECSGLSNACSLPNLDQMESDPDYNVTLTADMFTGMRQAMSAAQNMDVDRHDTPPNSPQFGYTPVPTPRPHFFLGW